MLWVALVKDCFAQNYGKLKPVDGILVCDVHKCMASSNLLMEFWFGMCTNL